MAMRHHVLCLLLLAASTATAAPVAVVELFQSQGCSSCPPANAQLNRIAARSDVLALSFAVTYWDQLGWKDRFARADFTRRQWRYAGALGNPNVWTPQMLVNGREAIIGGRAGEVDAALARAKRLDGSRLAVTGTTVRATPGAPAELWLVRYDPRVQQVAVGRGENAGRTLPHRNIVTGITLLGTSDGGPLGASLPAALPGEARALLLQASNSGQLLDARKL